MRNLIIGLLGATALAAASAASAQVVPLNSPTTISGSTATYTTDAGTITATGYSGPGTTTTLATKSDGDDENGLGLTNDPQHEISNAGPNFIQLDLSGLTSGTAVSFLMGSTTLAEGWQVFGTSMSGCGSTCSDASSVLTGDDEGVWHLLTGGYSYYDFYAIGTNAATNTQPANVLLGSLNVAVPEASTWAMMLLGFGAIGFVVRGNRKKAAVTQVA